VDKAIERMRKIASYLVIAGAKAALECHNAAHVNTGAARHRLLLRGGYADRRGKERGKE
jgi:hypothetical protein